MMKMKSLDNLDQVGIKIHDQFTAAVYSGKQVIKYSTRILFNFGWMNPLGSVFSVWMGLRTLAMCLITVFAAEYRCKKTSKEWEFCFPILSSAEGLIFASLVSFLLGLFTTNTFGRWWTVREKLSAVMNNITMVVVWTLNYVKAGDADPLIQNNRLKLIRLLNLSHSMVYKQANNDMNMQDLVQLGLLHKEEEEILRVAPNRCAVITAWQMSTMETFAAKVAPAAVFATMNTSVNAIFTASQDIFTLLDTQLPYSYLHLLSAIVKLHLIFVTFYAAGIVGQGIDAKLWSRIIFGFAVIIFNNCIYEGLLYIHDMLVNPLGNDRGDFPQHLYKANTEALTRFIQVQHAPQTQPEVLPKVESPQLSSRGVHISSDDNNDNGASSSSSAETHKDK